MNKILSYNDIPSLPKTFINWMCIPCLSAVTTIIWLYYRRKKKYYTEVLFFYPDAVNKCEKCLHTFSMSCSVAGCSSLKTRKIIHCLQNAKKSIDVCVFAISNEPIANEIINAFKRGILIRIVVSNCTLFHSKEIQLFQELCINIKILGDFEKSYMHNKFCIVDSTWLIHGSMNWTRQATFDNWESVLITNVKSLVVEFSKGFEEIWQAIS